MIAKKKTGKKVGSLPVRSASAKRAKGVKGGGGTIHGGWIKKVV